MKRRPAKQKAFLAAIAKTGNITRASKLLGMGRDSHYTWLESGKDYQNAFNEAMLEACERLEGEARRRAETGTLKPVFQGGKKVGVIREYSDNLLMFLLKGLMPWKYRERFDVRQTDGELDKQFEGLVAQLAAGREAATLGATTNANGQSTNGHCSDNGADPAAS